MAALLPLVVGAAAVLLPAPALAQPAAEEGYRSLDATSGWRQAGPGGFSVAPDGARTSYGGLGMTWYEAQEFGSYSFKVDWRYGTGGGNSGIFIGFPPSDDPYSAVNAGYEIQIDPEDPSGNTTGAIYNVQPPDTAARDGAVRTGPDEWNTYEVLVEGQRVRVLLNGVQVNDFTNTDPARGLGRGHIGLQNHGDGDAVVFRNIRIKELAPPGTDFGAPSGGTDLPPQEPGVTLRVFDLQTPQTRLCVPAAGQTPNVDKLLPTIDWTSADVFGVEDYFAAQVTANLTAPTAGEYAFRLISDDGSRLSVDGAVVIDHDGLHSASPPKDGTVTLTQGVHPLRIDHFENRVDQQLTLQWRPPGASEFVVVPGSALSTDAGAARPTAPGKKECGPATGLPQEPGVTLRVFDLQTPQTRLCTLKTGQTPNVDKLLPTIDWTSTDVFGVGDYFAAQVIANLTAPTAGEYAFRLISDDGSRLRIDGAVVVDHDFLHSADPPKDGTVTLTQGVHPLRIDYFENAYDQRLTLQWKPPGASEFVVVPTSALSTDAGVVRVTAPGKKECEQAGDSAGDGQPLTGVHPSYTLTDFRPPGFEPKVSGLDWFPDGRLAVLTWGGTDNSGSGGISDGEVFILSGVTGATSPGQVTVQKVADGLKEPMGIKIVDGTIYVSEKQRLTRLVDSTGDGVTDDYQTVADLPFGGNFHEFAFGLLYQEPHFLLNTSVSINLGGATTNPQPAANRGTTVKIDKNTGAISYVAGGLRTPNGIGYGPEGGIFVTDNQGDWLPVSKLLHVKQDRFFNHYTTPAGPFDANPVTPPVLWLPQNEIANSPSTPLQVTTGPFAGQMLIGDVTYGGIQRAYLEKIGGEYQGAVFRMTQGLEAGVTRISEGPDGAIYAGGLGAGGNWGQEGKLNHGLQKLTPNGTSTFDILAMRAVPGGFEVEYTQPVSPETANELATRYTAQQWRYVPTAAYGGPKVDQENLSVTSAVLSADGRKVTLQLAGLKAGHVVYLRSPRPFSSDSGQSLWSTEAWYTLNTLPG